MKEVAARACHRSPSPFPCPCGGLRGCETQNANRTVIDREIGLQGSLDEITSSRRTRGTESGIPDVLGDSGAPEAFVRSSLVAGDNSKRYGVIGPTPLPDPGWYVWCSVDSTEPHNVRIP